MAIDGSREWETSRPYAEVVSDDLEQAGIVFRCGQYYYRTTGKELGQGGMGTVFLMGRRMGPDSQTQAVVGKVFHPDFLLQLRTDAAAKHEHEMVMKNVDNVAKIDSPHLLPTYVSTRISDNYLIVSPLRSGTLREVIARGELSSRRKVELLMQAITGLSSMHKAGFLHRDFTVRNILVDDKIETASLFDFDLVLKLADVVGMDYKKRFQGRIFGSPGYSLVPEILDSALMESTIGVGLDIYALGTAIFALFTEQLPYGEAEDMWSLLLRVSEGVVRGERSYISYPDSVPLVVRPIIEHCMQRSPDLRPKSADEVVAALRAVLPKLQRDQRSTSSFKVTMRCGDNDSRLQSLQEGRADKSIGAELIATVDRILLRQGYQLQRSLGRVKGHAIFSAAPDPELIALGRFPDANIYPKIVTVLDLAGDVNSTKIVERWMTKFQPALRRARQGLMTPLHRVIYDAESSVLLLLTEHVEDARFGQDLSEHTLEPREAFGLGYLVAKQVARLHATGLAHNNVCPEALLLKGNRSTRRVHPAMVGIVAPSESTSDMHVDARNLAGLLLEWIDDAAISEAEPMTRARLEVIHADLAAIANNVDCEHTVSEVVERCEDGLSALDFNFGVLRENGGDIAAYALLVVGHSLYGRLWSQ
ncbi:MAG: protein kinase [Myxococcales bacterium]|nr:protein kinase [Myxococcales bacterium]